MVQINLPSTVSCHGPRRLMETGPSPLVKWKSDCLAGAAVASGHCLGILLPIESCVDAARMFSAKRNSGLIGLWFKGPDSVRGLN